MTTTTVPPIPDVNTDEWAAWVIDQLTNGGTLRPQDLAALIGAQTQQTRTVIVAMANIAQSGGGTGVTKTYVDVQDAATLAQAQAFDTIVHAYADTVGANTLTAANAYTDAQIVDKQGVSQIYVDTADASVLTRAEAYTDTSSAAAVQTANAYTDSQTGGVTAVTKSYVDTADANTLASANASAASGNAATLTSAENYTDSSTSALSGTLLSAMDTKDAANLSVAEAFATTADVTNLTNAKSYADTQDATKLATAQAFATAADVTNLAAAKTYADQYAVSDSGWILATNANSSLLAAWSNTALWWRKVGKHVQLNGDLTINSGNLAVQAGIFILPAAMRPDKTVVGLAVGFGNPLPLVRITINTTGSVDIGVAPSTTSTTARVDELSWFTA